MDVLSEHVKPVIILDEFQVCGSEVVLRKPAGLRDILGTKISLVFTGSIASMKEFLSPDEGAPFYGRLEEEVLIEPFPETLAKEFLRQGFEEAGVRVSEDVINLAIAYLGGFPG